MNGPAPPEARALMSHFAEGRYAEAERLARSVTARLPEFALGWTVLGATLATTGRASEALAPLQRAIALTPASAQAHGLLGDALADLGKAAEAEASYRRALRLQPDLVAVHCNLGSLLRQQGRLEEAESCYRAALERAPNLAAAHGNLGVVLAELGRLDEAEASHRRALQAMPAFAEAHVNLGNVLREQGRLEEAQASYRRALAVDPGLADAHDNLALLLDLSGDSLAALRRVVYSLGIRETPAARRIFVDCVKRVRFARDEPDVRALLVRAVAEPWGRPEELAAACVSLIQLAPDPPADPLLRVLLDSAPVCDLEMERYLAAQRAALLELATRSPEDATGLAFHAALARQCFINEYAWPCAAAELASAGALRDRLAAALEAGTPVPPTWPVAVGAYFPLNSLPHAARLHDLGLPGEVAAVLAQQVDEPEEERRMRDTIAQLTPIEDGVSLRVREQYEENPYPRWVKLPPSGEPRALDAALRAMFPFAAIAPAAGAGTLDVLVAGCGTGQHAIETARRYRGARVLAVDLSRASLAYAMRKTREMGLSCIEYAQADLTELGALDRRFDLVESAGVLHHLADPFAGWAVLLALVRPGGFMRIGLYSELARRDITRARARIVERGYGSTPGDIRRCRQELAGEAGFAFLREVADFYSTSACRDLLFHVQERPVTLAEVESFVADNGLAFLGFAVDPQVLHAYRQRFPQDRAAVELRNWQRFEHDHPGTFLGMYQFWVRKPG